ncbi:hypothetical protein [Pseudanabaena sp. FACHB-1998]|nr:hypothetical protein [Pseudanabaena sp. FACHB-1998]
MISDITDLTGIVTKLGSNIRENCRIARILLGYNFQYILSGYRSLRLL